MVCATFPGVCAPWAALLAALLVADAARAAHPLQTEDTGTQGAGNVEIENGGQAARSAGMQDRAYQPQLSYGLSPALDLIVQPSWRRHYEPGRGGAVGGAGDTDLDAKWRFSGAAPWSYAVRGGVTLATGQRGLGEPHGRTVPHAVLVATYDAAPYTVHANVGVARDPLADGGQRAWIGRVSCAVTWAVDARLTWAAEAGATADGNHARSGWPAALLAGAIYTLRPGLDVDAGYQSSVGPGSAANAREWLLGVTYRFAP